MQIGGTAAQYVPPYKCDYAAAALIPTSDPQQTGFSPAGSSDCSKAGSLANPPPASKYEPPHKRAHTLTAQPGNSYTGRQNAAHSSGSVRTMASARMPAASTPPNAHTTGNQAFLPRAVNLDSTKAAAAAAATAHGSNTYNAVAYSAIAGAASQRPLAHSLSSASSLHAKAAARAKAKLSGSRQASAPQFSSSGGLAATLPTVKVLTQSQAVIAARPIRKNSQTQGQPNVTQFGSNSKVQGLSSAVAPVSSNSQAQGQPSVDAWTGSQTGTAGNLGSATSAHLHGVNVQSRSALAEPNSAGRAGQADQANRLVNIVAADSAASAAAASVPTTLAAPECQQAAAMSGGPGSIHNRDALVENPSQQSLLEAVSSEHSREKAGSFGQKLAEAIAEGPELPVVISQGQQRAEASHEGQQKANTAPLPRFEIEVSCHDQADCVLSLQQQSKERSLAEPTSKGQLRAEQRATSNGQQGGQEVFSGQRKAEEASPSFGTLFKLTLCILMSFAILTCGTEAS